MSHAIEKLTVLTNGYKAYKTRTDNLLRKIRDNQITKEEVQEMIDYFSQEINGKVDRSEIEKNDNK